MGYRNYIGFIPKREYNRFKSLNEIDLCRYFNEECLSDINEWALITKLHDFGSNAFFDPPKNTLLRFFKDKVVHGKFNTDTELFVAKKEFLEYVIECYSERLKTHYKNTLGNYINSEFFKSVKPDDDNWDLYHYDLSKITVEDMTIIRNCVEHVKDMSWPWRIGTKPYDLKDGDKLTTSSKYEHVIFDLIRIYKTFDWKRNVLVYYGG